jgi:DNA-binding NtrC family response regulator
MWRACHVYPAQDIAREAIMKVLVVDDEEDILTVIRSIFEDSFPEVSVTTALDGDGALTRIREGEVNLVVSDLLMPGLDGEGLLEAVQRENPLIPVVIMSAHGTIDKAVQLLQAGARDFITKPFRNDDFVHRIRLALETLKLKQELRSMRQELLAERKGGRIIYSSRLMEALLSRLPVVAKSSAPVLITGESGTGKELLAREIHSLGPRRDRPFVAINCGAFPETLLESEMFGYKKGAFTGAVRDHAGVIMESNHGTLFLDEIGETSLNFQVKLLRFLQEGEIRALGDGKTISTDTRIVAATNKDLRVLMEQGRFREDLFYRLNVIPLHIPPLRERREDILVLANAFLRRYAQEAGRNLSLSPLAAQKLAGYPWPGNVRELENKIRQVSILAPTNPILPEDIELEGMPAAPETVSSSSTFKEARRVVVDRFERSYLRELLSRHQGSPTRASEEAGLDRKNLWRLLKKHRLKVEAFKA